MRKINFALISDVLFYTLCAFLVCFTAIRYFFKSAVVALIVAVLFAALVCLVTLFSLIRRREKLIATTVGEGERKLLALHLATLPQKDIIALFKNALDGTYAVGNHLEDGQNAYYFNFKISPLTCDDIADILRNRTDKDIVLLCCVLTPEAVNFAADFGVKTLCVTQLYELLKDKDLLPEKYAFDQGAKKGVFKKIKKRFNRRLCPSLFFSGFFLLIYSFFSFYPVWYVVTGGLLTILSAVCLFFSESRS